jgi:glutathione S-transferase
MRLFGWLRGEAPRRDPALQAALDERTRALSLYQAPGCMYCLRVRRAIRRLGLRIEPRDVSRSTTDRERLIAGGGRSTVPCLRIEQGAGEVRWLYESRDIVDYLEEHFDDRRRPRT